MKIKKEHIQYIITLLLAVVLLIAANRYIAPDYSEISGRTDYGSQKARVTKIIERTTAATKVEGVSGDDLMIVFEAQILTGLAKGDIVTASQIYTPFSTMMLAEVKVGDKIIVYENLDLESDINWYLSEYVRIDTIVVLAVVFGILLLVFGGIKGFNTMVSLALTCGAVFGVFIPAVLSGYNIYLWAVIICTYIILMTLLVINGANAKSFAEVLGCTGGVLVTAFITI